MAKIATDVDMMFDVNVYGRLRVAKAFAPILPTPTPLQGRGGSGKSQDEAKRRKGDNFRSKHGCTPIL
ncbi:hypothetical protein [Mesorhizobium sp. M1348]|uniref:hypothetical protein n=1 Tax=unclassified Mesorhizobium TaxID=325217 RepID=UPI0033367592